MPAIQHPNISKLTHTAGSFPPSQHDRKSNSLIGGLWLEVLQRVLRHRLHRDDLLVRHRDVVGHEVAAVAGRGAPPQLNAGGAGLPAWGHDRAGTGGRGLAGGRWGVGARARCVQSLERENSPVKLQQQPQRWWGRPASVGTWQCRDRREGSGRRPLGSKGLCPLLSEPGTRKQSCQTATTTTKHAALLGNLDNGHQTACSHMEKTRPASLLLR